MEPDDNDDDPFGWILKEAHISSSLESQFQHCSYWGMSDSDYSDGRNPVQNQVPVRSQTSDWDVDSLDFQELSSGSEVEVEFHDLEFDLEVGEATSVMRRKQLDISNGNEEPNMQNENENDSNSKSKEDKTNSKRALAPSWPSDEEEEMKVERNLPSPTNGNARVEEEADVSGSELPSDILSQKIPASNCKGVANKGENGVPFS